MSRLKALLLGAMLGGVPALAIPIALHAAADQQVTIDNFAFTPQNLSVTAGTAVTWKNRDDIPHSIVIGSISVHSHPLDTDQTFSYTFDKAGTYQYMCGLHPNMHGQIVVQ
jgi:plastocyanin